jgi:hypothetical protein
VEVEVRVPDVLGDVFDVNTMPYNTNVAPIFGTATILPATVSADSALVGLISVVRDDVTADRRFDKRDILGAVVHLAPHSWDVQGRAGHETYQYISLLKKMNC